MGVRKTTVGLPQRGMELWVHNAAMAWPASTSFNPGPSTICPKELSSKGLALNPTQHDPGAP